MEFVEENLRESEKTLFLLQVCVMEEEREVDLFYWMSWFQCYQALIV